MILKYVLMKFKEGLKKNSIMLNPYKHDATAKHLTLARTLEQSGKKINRACKGACSFLFQL